MLQERLYKHENCFAIHEVTESHIHTIQHVFTIHFVKFKSICLVSRNFYLHFFFCELFITHLRSEHMSSRYVTQNITKSPKHINKTTRSTLTLSEIKSKDSFF